MRLFVAIPLPDKVIEELQAICTPLPGIKWTEADQYHLTLRFIGDVQPPVKERIDRELSSIVHKPFEMCLNGFGFFPDKESPRVFWAAIDPNPELLRLQEKVEEACQDAGLEAENRSFVPHVTIARVKHWPEEMEALVQKHHNFTTGSIPVRKFNLYESRLLKKKAEHKVVSSYKL